MKAYHRSRIHECEKNKQEITWRVENIKREYAHLSRREIQRHIQQYLGEKTYDEWMALYDGFIHDSRRVLAKQERKNSSKSGLILGSILVALCILGLLFLPTMNESPVGAFIFGPNLEKEYLVEEMYGQVDRVQVKESGSDKFSRYRPEEGESPLDLKIEYDDKTEVLLNDLPREKKIDLRYGETKRKAKIHKEESLVTFALDPSAINFTNGELKRVAQGKQLWKCLNWSYENEECLGEWTLLQEVTPGEEYTITFNATDPGFAETNLTIINVQSYPVRGGEWQVNFDTIGEADLYIRASNGTSWSESEMTGDLKFLEIRCGDEILPYEWISDAIHVANYSCNVSGFERSKVLTTGKHTLEFHFGNKTAYAKNYATAEGVLMLFDSAGGQDMNVVYPTGANHTWDTVYRADSLYNFTSGTRNVTVNQDGVYRISYGVSFTRSTANTRVEHLSRVLLNGVEANACIGQTYTRGVEGVTDGVATSDCLLNLSAGDEIVINGARSSSTSLATTTIADRDWFHMQYVPDPKVALVRDAAGGQSVDNVAGAVLDWDTAESIGSSFNFTATADNITINEDGIYRLTYGVRAEMASNTRYAIFGEVLVNGAIIAEGHSHTYIRGNTGARDGVLTADSLLNLSAGDYVQIQVGRESTTSVAATTTGDSVWFQMERLTPSDTNVLMLQEGGGGQSVDTTIGADIDWDTAVKNDSDFTMTDTNTVEVQRTGLYRVVYGVYTNRTTTGNRFNTFGTLRVNGADYDACWSSAYMRGEQGGINSYEGLSFASCLVNLTSGDDLEVRIGRESSVSLIASVVANKSWWYLQSLDTINEPPTVTNLLWPENNTNHTSIPIDFNFTAEDDQNDMTCALWGDFGGSWAENATVSNVQNATTTNITISPNDGIYNWSIRCEDQWGLYDWYSSNYTILVDTNPPEFASEVLNVSIINQTHGVRLNVTVTDLFDVVGVNATLKYPNGTSLDFVLTEDGANVWYLLFSDTNSTGVYNFTNIIARDNHNNTRNDAYGDLTFNVTASPPTAFDLLSPGNDTVSTSLTPTFTWSQSGDEHFANYTILLDTDPAFGSPDYVYATYQFDNTSYDAGPLGANIPYWWKVIAFDVFGSSTNSTSSYLYTTDTITPSIVLTYPGDDDFVIVNSFDFNYTPTDTNLWNCSLWGDFNGSWSLNQSNSTPLNTQPNYYPIVLEDGTYSWNVECLDRAGVRGSAPVNYTVLVDTTPPLINLESPPHDDYESSTNNIVFYYNVTDTMTDIDNCILIIDDEQKGSADISIAEGVSQNFTAFLDNGVHNWSINCTDKNGWVNSSVERNITVDVLFETDPPVINLNFPGYAAYLQSNNVTFNYTPNDATGIENCSIYIDAAWNETNTTVPVNQPNYFSIFNFTETLHTWYVDCYDNNTYVLGTSETRNFTVDLTDPTVTLNAPGDDDFFSFNDVVFNYTPTDTNLKNCTLYGNFSGIFSPSVTNSTVTSGVQNTITLPLSDGTYLWNVLCTDESARNESASLNYTVKVDANAPIISNESAEPTTPTTYIPGKFYRFNVTVEDAYLDTVWIEHNFSGFWVNASVNASTSSTFSFNISNLAAGGYAYRWYANDSLNRIVNTTLFTYEVQQNTTIVDLLLNGTDGNLSVVENSIVNITGSLVNPVAGYLELYLDGLLINNGSTPLENLTLFTDPGVYNVTLLYSQTENYTSASETHFIFVNDTIEPNISLIFPGPNASIATAQVTFSYNVTDFSSILNCSLYINGTFNKSDGSISKGMTQSFSQTFVDGNYSWEIRCYDSWDNVGYSEERNFTISEATNITVNISTDKSTYEEWEYATITTNTSDKFGNPLATNITTDLILGNTSTPWWNANWTFRKPILLSQNETYTRNATVVVNLTGLNLSNCTKEIRIVRNDAAILTLEEHELLDGDDATWCKVRFNAQISASAINETRYYAYYGNAVAVDPGFSFTPISVDVQRDTLSSSSTGFTQSIAQVDTDNAFLLFSYNSADTSPDGGMVTGQLTQSQVQFSKYVAASTTVAWQVVEHPDIDVQRGSIDMAVGNDTINVTLDDAILLNESFIIITSRTDSSSLGDHHDGWMTARFINETEIQIQRGTTVSNAHAEWQVVQWRGANVQNRTRTLTGVGSLTATVDIDPVNTSKSFIIRNRRTTDTASGINDQFVRTNFTNSTEVYLDRNDDDGTMDIVFFVVEAPSAYSQQNPLTQSALSDSITINEVNESHAFSLATWESTGNGQTFTNAYEYNHLVNGTNLSIVKQTTRQTHTIDTFVVEITLDAQEGAVGNEEKFIASNTTEALSGTSEWMWDTLGQPLGNYSAVSLVTREFFKNGTATTYFEIVPDATPPNVTLFTPGNDSNSSNLFTIFTYLPDDRHLDNCTLWHNGSGIFSAIENDTAPVHDENNTFGDTFTDGYYSWNVACVDTLGNSAFATANYTFRVDTIGPRIALLSPSDNGFANSSTVNLTYNVADLSNIGQCQLYIDGVLNDTDPSPDQGVNSFIVSSLSETSYEWHVLCEDEYGNDASSLTRSFTVDVTPPAAFDILTPDDGTTSSLLSPTLIWEETTETNFWNYTLQVSLSRSFTPSVTTEYVTFAKNRTNRTLLPLQANQIYYWRVVASDRAGWTTYSNQNFSYITDDAPPVVLLVDPVDGNNDPDGNVTLIYQANDNGLANCTLYTNITGTWLPEENHTSPTPWQHESFNVTGLTTGTNFTFIWNVHCFDSLGFSAWASANRSVRIGDFNETYNETTIPTNATVNNTLPRVDSVSLLSSIDLIANGQQQVNCSANVSDDNGAAEILDAHALFYHSSVAAGDPDNASNHYTNASCASCTAINSITATCTCSFDLWFYSLPGTWTCEVTPIDAEGDGDSLTNTTTVNQLQAVDVTPTLIDYGDAEGGVPAPEQNVSVINLGNVPIDVDLWGYAITPGDDLAMSCLNGANITIGAERFSTAQGTAYNSMTPLSGVLGSAPTASMSIPVRSGAENSTLPLYWSVQSGSGVLGACNGTIVFHAQIA